MEDREFGPKAEDREWARKAGEQYAHLNNRLVDGTTVEASMIPKELTELTKGALASALLIYQAEDIEKSAHMFGIINLAWFQAGMEYERNKK